ncbi:1649_t:CDS:2 [Entrophospora sp. SA101]|nr:1649_t:CDS:2 [Entrophospora sp. SA101]
MITSTMRQSLLSPKDRISRGLASNRELELEQVNQALRDELSNEVSINRSNEKYINELERKCIRCENEIQSLNKELVRLENVSEGEKAELRLEISSLKRSLYQAKKEIRDKDHIIPVTMHNVKNNLEVNCATASQNDKSSVSDQISQEVDSNEGGNEPLEDEWHAPAGFSLDFDDPSLKKTRD